MASLDDSFKSQAATTGGGGGELDGVKRILTDTNPILLVTTVVVSLLHMLFEMLAFTSGATLFSQIQHDRFELTPNCLQTSRTSLRGSMARTQADALKRSHWKNKKELVGVSVRTIITNCVVQLIIRKEWTLAQSRPSHRPHTVLYLIDQNEDTSWMILGGQGMGLVIEAWKITKAVDIKVVPSAGTLVPYKLEITDKHVLTEEELKTQEYDQLAFRWVSYGTTPLLIGYTIYSMYYNEHRSWYSFVISTATSFVYAFVHGPN